MRVNKVEDYVGLLGLRNIYSKIPLSVQIDFKRVGFFTNFANKWLPSDLNSFSYIFGVNGFSQPDLHTLQMDELR